MSKFVLALDSWQIKSFLNCEEEFNLSYIQNLRRFRILPPEKRYTDKGTLIHAILDSFYTLRALNPEADRFTHGTATINLIKKNKLVQKAGFDADFENFIIERFKQYLFKYSTFDFVPLRRGLLVGVETPFSIKLYEDDERLYMLEGRIDLLVKQIAKNFNQPGFLDHKTQEKLSDYYEKKIQFLCYALATGYEYGIINYFGLQKKYSEEISLRQKLIFISKEQIERFRKYLVSEVYPRIEKAVKTNTFAKNLNSCAGSFETHPCFFTTICDACDVPERQQLIKSTLYETTKPWSPWNDAEGKEELEVEL